MIRYLGTISVLFFINLFFAKAVSANPVKLSCTTDNGRSAGTVVVDLDANTLIHGTAPPLKITSAGGEYIVAINSWDSGGQVWLIEKSTGRYAMGSAGIYCESEQCKNEKISGFTMEGVCIQSPF
jgi:hypothetical protein